MGWKARFGKCAQRIGLVIVLIMTLLRALQIVSLFTARPGVGYFRSATGRDEYVARYEEAMRQFSVIPRSRDVETRLGIVRVYEWSTDETKNSVPVVLIPGRSSGVPMWAENVESFAGKHRVIAFDALGDAGMSVQSAPIGRFEDQAVWIHDVLAQLAPDGAHIVGHSFGGATATVYAREYPEDVRSLAVLEPVFTFSYPPFRLMSWTMVASIPMMPRSWREHALGKVGGTDYDADEPMARMIDAGAAHYKAALPTPHLVSKEEAEHLTMPVYAAIASNDSLAGGAKAAERAQELIPQAEVETWPNTTHSLPMQAAESLGEKLNNFWANSE